MNNMSNNVTNKNKIQLGKQTSSSSARSSSINVVRVEVVPIKIFIDFKVTMAVLATLNMREKGYIIGIRAYLKHTKKTITVLKC